VVNEDLARAGGRWPIFAAEALAAGFASVHALPMRLRGAVIGALNLFNVDPGTMRPADIAAAQAMADVATIAVLQHRASVEAQIINEQLSHALNSRVIIEQAKGMRSARVGIDVDQAFGELRSHPRNHNRRLVDVAQDVLDGRLSRDAFNLLLLRSINRRRTPPYPTRFVVTG
jgi:GAF domain-containing protein